MKKGELIPKILEILQAQAEATVDLIDIMTSGYGESYRKVRRGMKYGPREFKTDWADTYRENQIFYSLLNQLKQQGFIEKKNNIAKKGSIWHITKKGREKLRASKNISAKDRYGGTKDGKIRIIIYDIPEKNRKHRDWLRHILEGIDFSLLQESVWLGTTTVSEELFGEMRQRDIVRYVHIFEISKSGTVKKI